MDNLIPSSDTPHPEWVQWSNDKFECMESSENKVPNDKTTNETKQETTVQTSSFNYKKMLFILFLLIIICVLCYFGWRKWKK